MRTRLGLFGISSLLLASGAIAVLAAPRSANAQDQNLTPSGAEPGSAAVRPATGSGVEYQITSPQFDGTLATAIVGQEADGYWVERRTIIHMKNMPEINMVSKDLMAGDPPMRKRRISQINGGKPREVPLLASGEPKLQEAKPRSDKGLIFLEALVVALDTLQSSVAQRQVQQAAKPIRGDLGRAQYAGKESAELHPAALPPQPRAPASGSPPAVVNPGGTGNGGATVANLTKLGTESVTVPAGTFECDHYTGDSNGKRTDYWLSSRLSSPMSPRGIVKTTSGDGSIVLQRILDHETSQIKGEPEK